MSSRFVPRQPFIGVQATTLRADGSEATLVLALDTGATFSMLSDRAWRILGFDASRMGVPVQMAAVGGMASGRWAELAELSALGRKTFKVRIAVVHTPPRVLFHGLLGLDFFRGSRLTIDFRRGEIELET